jgi:hypothetical protein
MKLVCNTSQWMVGIFIYFHEIYYYKIIIILPAVLFGCETWYHTLREVQRWRVFENRVLRRIFRNEIKIKSLCFN